MLTYQGYIFSLKEKLIMYRLFQSIGFVFSNLFSRKVYDVVFYYPQHFNRDENSENPFFKPYYDLCNRNNLSYIILEEPCVGSKSNTASIPFDFIFYVVQLLRRVIPLENVIDKDNSIGIWLGKSLLRSFKFKNVVVISKSMLSFFRGLNSSAKIFDLQHGIIHSNKSDYFINSNVSVHLERNDVFLLLFGEGFRNILVEEDSTNYMKNHCFQLGFSESNNESIHDIFNNNILITLQFTHDHSKEENLSLLDSINSFVSKNPNVNFYLKHHPRFNNEVNLSFLFSLENVNIAPVHLVECFKLCSLHATAYSTSVFEAAQYGIPSIIINPLQKFDYFKSDFRYPLEYSISDFKDNQIYQKSVEVVMNWKQEYYSPFNELKFLDLLK